MRVGPADRTNVLQRSDRHEFQSSDCPNVSTLRHTCDDLDLVLGQLPAHPLVLAMHVHEGLELLPPEHGVVVGAEEEVQELAHRILCDVVRGDAIRGERAYPGS